MIDGNINQLEYLFTFSKDTTDVDLADFIKSGDSNGLFDLDSVSPVSGSTSQYVVTLTRNATAFNGLLDNYEVGILLKPAFTINSTAVDGSTVSVIGREITNGSVTGIGGTLNQPYLLDDDFDNDGTKNSDEAPGAENNQCLPTPNEDSCDADGDGVTNENEVVGEENDPCAPNSGSAACTSITTIKNYADNNGGTTAPALSDFSQLNIVGVNGVNINEINSVIAGLAGSDVDDTAEIQAIVDGIVAKNAALAKIEAYADDNANPAPVLADYSAAGVTGVTASNIAEINAAIAALTGADVDTQAEIQAIVDGINANNAALTELKEDIAGNTNNDLVEASELNAIRGVSGAIQANQAEYQAAFIATTPSPFNDPVNPTPAEIQAVIDSVNTIVANETAAFNELKNDIAGDNNNDLIEASELNAIRGVSGALQENQTAYQAAFSATSPSPFNDPANPTPAEIQAIITAINNNDVDSDNDGLPDSVDANDDNDALTDDQENNSDPVTSSTDACDPDPRNDSCDFDQDGTINANDSDDDNDGLNDGDEVTDANRSNVDSDGNGICDGPIAFPATETFKGCMPAVNGDSNADYDNDGTNDSAEMLGDTDGDLIPDYLDADDAGTAFGDSDNDGIDDKTECGDALPCRDTDKDGTYDYLDTDSDNDGISDDEEADGIDSNGQNLAVTDGTVKPKDTDADGTPDYRDTDSDNDGNTDLAENAPVGKDSDSDGIPDVVDFDDNNSLAGGGDSDNDGLTDEEECPSYPTNCPDSDNDGKLDYLDNNTDSDADGIPDGDEDSNLDKDNNPATNPRDTDSDGTPDYLDTDSDGDGINDADERNDPYVSTSLKDSDNDGIPDVIDSTVDSANAPGDADSDGILDSIECASLPCRDTDGDGVPDYTDTDSDNDNISDADELGSDPSTPLDSDNDGVFDYLDSALVANVITEQDLGTIKTGVQGAGSLHWGFVLVLSLLVVFRRKSATLIALPLFMASFGANAEWWEDMDLYVGAGIGQSYLDPEVGGTAFEVDDHTQNAWKLTGGWDLNDFISVEGYYTELGSVDLGNNADIDYRMMGADGIFHYWARGEAREEGSIALYAKVGLNHMTNNANGVRYEQDNNLQLFGGVGAELYLQRKFSVRLEIESYDTDAALLSLNLVKRFGFASKRAPKQARVVPVLAKPIAPKKPIVPINPVEIVQPVAVAVILDTDNDGVLDDKDQCLSTPKGLTVDKNGCAAFDGKIGDLITNIQFQVNSAALTDSSKVALDEIAVMLTSYAAVKIEVQAHSDNTGSAAYNKRLSQKRAESVVDYLTSIDVDPKRLFPRGFGEDKPIADNSTADGRSQNRRVEFVVKQR